MEHDEAYWVLTVATKRGVRGRRLKYCLLGNVLCANEREDETSTVHARFAHCQLP
jgi:hypothetical protein